MILLGLILIALDVVLLEVLWRADLARRMGK